MVPYKLDVEQLKSAVEGSGGILTIVSARLGVHRRTLAQWRDNVPEVKQILAQEEDEQLDRAEAALFQLIGEGNVRAINFFLGTRGKNRGYTQRVENELSGHVESRVTVYLPDNQRGDRDLDAIDDDVALAPIPTITHEDAPCVTG